MRKRATKVRGRIDHHTAQKVEEGDTDRAGVGDPRENEPNTAQSAPHDNDDANIHGPEQFQIGSPSKNDITDVVEELDDGPNMISEMRMRTPVCALP